MAKGSASHFFLSYGFNFSYFHKNSIKENWPNWKRRPKKRAQGCIINIWPLYVFVSCIQYCVSNVCVMVLYAPKCTILNITKHKNWPNILFHQISESYFFLQLIKITYIEGGKMFRNWNLTQKVWKFNSEGS